MRSTSGYAFTFGSGVFSWSLVKQHCVALSMVEAEYISATEATAQATCLRFVLEDFGETHIVATPLNCDSTSAIVITKNPIFHQKTKHINRMYHFIKEALQNGIIDSRHIHKGTGQGVVLSSQRAIGSKISSQFRGSVNV
ncbi:hypothetical protein ACFX2G_010350 [Malus domestica]